MPLKIHREELNRSSYAAQKAELGTKLDGLITLVNELRDAWSGTYTNGDELTWADTVRDLTNELRDFAIAARELSNELRTSAIATRTLANDSKDAVNAVIARLADNTGKTNLAIALANATKAAFNTHIGNGEHAALTTVNVSALTVSVADVLTVTAAALSTVSAASLATISTAALGTINTAALATLSALAIGLPTIDAAAVDVLT